MLWIRDRDVDHFSRLRDHAVGDRYCGVRAQLRSFLEVEMQLDFVSVLISCDREPLIVVNLLDWTRQLQREVN
jgi:hypothetical protein